MNAQIYQFLLKHPPFSFLDLADIDLLTQKATTALFSNGALIYVQQKSEVNQIAVVAKGALKIFLVKENENLLQQYLEEGEIYGGISVLLNEGISLRTVQAWGSTELILIPADDFRVVCEHNKEFTDFFTDLFSRRMMNRAYAELISASWADKYEETDAERMFYNRQITDLFEAGFARCHLYTPIQQAAQIMTQQKQGAILIYDHDDAYQGIVTDNDLRRKVVACALDLNTPVSEIMSKPLLTIDYDAFTSDAVLLMMQRGIKHLAVADQNGQIIGMLTNRHLIISQGQSPVHLVMQINRAHSADELNGITRILPGIVQHILNSGARADVISRVITAVSDTVLHKVMEFSLQELGPPPAPFVFMVLGSEGRGEQTLKTDQDNALVYADMPDEETKQAAETYFLKLGKLVCNRLNNAGYDFCTGNIMAGNPQWCQPLSRWKEYFRNWVYASETSGLLNSTIFFDFKAGYGNVELTNDLRAYLFELLNQRGESFFFHLASCALQMRLPVGMFGGFSVSSVGKQQHVFDIKKAMIPLVDYARIYALENHITHTNTFERFEKLYEKGILNAQDFEALFQAYHFLMKFRLLRQVQAVTEENRAPDNYINPDKLTQLERKMLKEIFALTEKHRRYMQMRFTGR
ncbi:CBS domain-containing protein [Sphingobacteriales bacterium UPWRP_1]|nr:hypothetical protein BVG80_08940 [Sphingobacteriales bacterium TSM_CSM]PSJ76167.1 CBS domain-containing protein [Sphingobacteriales bacterium UPWRP_1]